MNRRSLILGASLALLACGPALADRTTDRVSRDLTKQGFRQIEVSSTWLGRTRIVGTGPDGRREIILNPRTGEILRDLWEPSHAETDGGSRGDLVSTTSRGGEAANSKDTKDDDRKDDDGKGDSKGGDDDGDDDGGDDGHDKGGDDGDKD